MIFGIPTSRIESDYPQTSVLDGTVYLLHFRWNERSGHWFLTMSDLEGNRLITGRKVCTRTPWAQHETIDGAPPGKLWPWTVEADDSDPGLRDLGSRVFLLYTDEASTA